MRAIVGLWVLAALTLAACGRPEPATSLQQPAAAAGGQLCRVGPDDGPPASVTPVREAERGIGGTGAPSLTQVAERGIGGTGIVGTITGFASICVNGLEVGVDPATSVHLEDSVVGVGALRVGQVIVATAAPTAEGGLVAESVIVRYEVSGPVERVTPGGGQARVAGQTVRAGDEVPGRSALAPGSWVSVSGFRHPDGAITATRIDRRAPGAVSVRGMLVNDVTLRIGALPLRLAPGVHVPGREPVLVVGTLDGSVLIAETVALDRLASDPASSFGPAVDRILLESYADYEAGRVRFGTGYATNATSGIDWGASPGVGIVDLRRGEGGGFTAFSRAPMAQPLRSAPLSAPLGISGPTGPGIPGPSGPMPNRFTQPGTGGHGPFGMPGSIPGIPQEGQPGRGLPPLGGSIPGGMPAGMPPPFR